MKNNNITIKSKNSIFDFKIKDVFEYRDLIFMLIKRDITIQYKQTILGPLWFIVQPAITTLIYIIVFGNIAKISTDGLPKPLFYLSGVVLWDYFQTCINKTSTTFINNQHIFSKVYFPRLIMPISSITSNLLRLGVQLILFAIVYVYYILQGIDISLSIYALFIPLLIVITAFIALGPGLILASLTTKYRDLSIMFTFFLSLWMYATPVIYPMSTMPDKYKTIILLNPLTPIFEAFKYCLLGVGTFSFTQILYSLSVTVIVLFLGIVLFNKAQRNFIDTI